MGVKQFFLKDRLHLLAGVLALGLFVGGAVALTQAAGVAGVLLLLAGFVVTMFLEYRHVHHT